MLRHRGLIFFISALFLTTLACNAFAGEVEPALELPPPIIAVATDSPAVGETAVPGLAPTATAFGVEAGGGTAVASGGPQVTTLVDLNIRSGPGIVYDRIGFLLEGTAVAVIGRDPLTGWWKIQCPGGVNAPECWVSGGRQFTAAANTEGVPAVANIPPTPTVVPTVTPTAEPISEPRVQDAGAGWLAYADSAGLWLAPLDMSQEPPTSGSPVLRVAGAGISRVLIAPNGRFVAYVAGDSAANRLGVVSVDGSGGQTLVTSAEVTTLSPDEQVELATLIADVQWLPNSQGLLFNADILNQVGPAAFPQNDLWRVTLDGTLTALFEGGSAGDTFALSPDGRQLIMGTSTSLIRANLDGTEAETVYRFDFINTASEYAFAPQAQWQADGAQALAAIPGADPWQPEAETTLVVIPAAGPAEVAGVVAGNTLFSPVRWAPDGRSLAYVRFTVNVPEVSLLLGEATGRALQPYRTGDQLTFHGWSPDGGSFLYAGSGFYGVGQSGKSPTEALLSVAVFDMRWLNSRSFVVAAGSGTGWSLSSANLAGAVSPLAVVNSDNVPFDVWAP